MASGSVGAGSGSSWPSTSASSQKEFFFGWDLLFKTVEHIVNKKSDILVALAHFVLVKHSSFRCIGVGDDKTVAPDDAGSELLPDGWNDDDHKYALRYLHGQDLYLLLGHRTEDCLIINLLNVATKKVSNIGLEPETLVVKVKGTLRELIPCAAQVADRYKKELIDTVFAGTTKEVTTQTNVRETRSDPLRITDPLRPPMGQFVPPTGIDQPPFGFPEVGRGDLDPLGRGGPGNLFPFPSHPDFRGARVPQPRFDPFGPNGRNIPPNPNPDHMQPPNFGGHDFYM